MFLADVVAIICLIAASALLIIIKVNKVLPNSSEVNQMPVSAKAKEIIAELANGEVIALAAINQ